MPWLDTRELAAIAAEIEDDYAVRYYPEKKPFIEEFIEKMSTKVQISLFGVGTDPITDEVLSLQHLKGLQARLPGDLEIN